MRNIRATANEERAISYNRKEIVVNHELIGTRLKSQFNTFRVIRGSVY